MALFERCYGQLIKLDDTQEINCTVETAQNVNGHTEYVLRVQRGSNKENSWKVLRRYNDFAELHKCLCISGIDLPMPGKKLIGNMRAEFIAERRKALQKYIDTVLMNPILASSLPTKRFVDPDSYSQSFHDQAVQNALLCLRSEGVWALGATMGAIGWRVRKHYFKVTPKPPDKAHNKLLVKSVSQTQHHHHHQHNKNLACGTSYSSSGSLDVAMFSPFEMVLEWLEYGPDKYLDDKELAGVLKSLTGLQHNHIESIVSAANNENGCLVIRKFHKHGTLKDMLCMVATPRNTFLSKYGNPKGRTALTINEVAKYGRQILEALIFLHAKGFPYGHLHSGNVAIVDGCVKLLDIENYILGVPAFYRPFFVQHSKLHTLEAIDVYCFGHVLFEMTMGYPMQESVLRQLNDCPKSLKNLLEAILSKEACRASLPTLEQVQTHQFFSEYPQKDGDSAAEEASNNKPHLKLSLSAKEQLALSIQKCEHRLREEQKSVKNQKRMVRVQELMSSEEEKRKSKHKAKVDQKQLKLKQQNSIQTSNGRQQQQHQSSIEQVTHPTVSSASRFNRTDSVSMFKESRAASSSLSSEKSTDQPARSPKETTAPAVVERQSSSPNMTTDAARQGAEEDEPTRSALLESICKFNRGSLRKVRSND